MSSFANALFTPYNYIVLHIILLVINAYCIHVKVYYASYCVFVYY